ncbi:ribonuclease HI [Adlercreutzia murintestinalis]|uniref:ribonuclease HI n=1 Tax=Adlercreutzia murintestinalis TaxID=2941325 RepID=UPI00203FC828|nr:ribonuclease HI [Adlercreutzia murintestinalis]
MKSVVIYTDGSARRNPGNGGYGALLRYTAADGTMHEMRLSQGFRLTTNNRMELLGVIVALEALKEPCEVVVHTDSQYVCNAFTQGWIDKWQQRGWKKTKSEPVKNVDLWKRLLLALGQHRVSFEWVRGHAGVELNEECDRLATEAADSDELAVDVGYEGLDQAVMDL